MAHRRLAADGLEKIDEYDFSDLVYFSGAQKQRSGPGPGQRHNQVVNRMKEYGRNVETHR